MHDPNNIIEYLRRSYTAVDGLWFVKLEEEFGFDKALEIDEKVWRIMSKIQARKAKELLEIKGNSSEELLQALILKFEAENYQYECLKREPGRLEIAIKNCPWLTILKKAGRLHLAEKVAKSICPPEFASWAKEFGAKSTCQFLSLQCAGDKTCHLTFLISGE